MTEETLIAKLDELIRIVEKINPNIDGTRHAGTNNTQRILGELYVIKEMLRGTGDRASGAVWMFRLVWPLVALGVGVLAGQYFGK